MTPDAAAAAVPLAFCAAAAYGASDFIGGWLSKRASPWAVACMSQATAALGTVIIAAFGSLAVHRGELGWALLAGLGNGAGNVLIYRGLGRGRMAVVAPIAAIASALVPVLAGVLGGERPVALAWAGMLLSLPAIWLVAGGGRLRDVRLQEVRDGLLAGLGFGIQFSALGQIDPASGLAPLALSQVVSVAAIAGAAALQKAPWVPRERPAQLGALAGILAGAATLLFQLAAQTGQLAVAGVVASLYPAGTILLAALFLRERVSARQGVGLALAGAAVALIASG